MNEHFRYIPQYSRYKHRIENLKNHEFEIRIVLISDSHITTVPNGAFNQKIWDKGLNEILNIKNVDYILHLGDLVHDGTYLEYEKALNLIKPINTDNFRIIPGNHDSRNVGYRLFEDYFGNRTFEIDDPHLHLIGVDSSEPDENGGVLGNSAIQKSRKQFQKYDDKLKIYCFHHHLLPIPNTGRERAAIWDSGDVIDMLLEENINLVLNGHHHISNVYTLTDGDCDLGIFNAPTISCNKTRYNELFSYTIMDVSDKVVKFTIKSLYDGSIRERGRFINQKFLKWVPQNEKPYTTVVHLGNTHFGEGKFNQFMFYQAMGQINSLNPDVVIHTGSLTYNNQMLEYEIAAKFLNKIKPPLLIMPGFKDLGKYGWQIFPDQFGRFEPNLETDKFRVIGVNAVNPNIPSGKIGRSRMKEVYHHFRESKHNKFNIIATNSRLIPSPKLKYDKLIADAGDVLDKFTHMENQIDLILTGRNNIGCAIQVEDTVLSMCGSICSHQTVLLEYFSYNIIHLYENGFVQVIEHNVEDNIDKIIGSFWTQANIKK